MNWPSKGSFLEARRCLPALAAALFVAALLFPMWVIDVHAVQYPNRVLQLKLYAYPHIAGDYAEMAALNHYIGFYYPDPVFWPPNYQPDPYAIDVPEWSFGPVAFVGVAALSVFVAVAPTAEKLKRGLKWQLVGTLGVFGIMVVDIQYRLWQAGHHLDPGAPVIGVRGFTPPLWGVYEVANITSYSQFGRGVDFIAAAVALLGVAFYYRDSDAPVTALPRRAVGRVRGAVGWVRGRGRGGEGSDPTEAGSDARGD
jgi:hypothetical protein